MKETANTQTGKCQMSKRTCTIVGSAFLALGLLVLLFWIGLWLYTGGRVSAAAVTPITTLFFFGSLFLGGWPAKSQKKCK